VWADVGDALASAANYLRNLGWDDTRAWGREVVLPAGFDPALASVDTNAMETVKPLSTWSDLGVRRAGGAALPTADIAAALVLPAGARGPAFMVYENYRVILQWNRSTFYALAIGHLIDRLAGGGPLASSRGPIDPLTRANVVALQQGLSVRGYLKPGEVDGVFGAGTRRALRAFQRDHALPADGYVDTITLPAVLAGLASST
jgi:membrane-bound lytic murein transglycosylase B